MPAHAAAIFLSAFLLFQVQPLGGKVLLPWYGGSAAVWADISPATATHTATQLAAAVDSRPLPSRPPVTWTDEYGNLFGLLDRGRP